MDNHNRTIRLNTHERMQLHQYYEAQERQRASLRKLNKVGEFLHAAIPWLLALEAIALLLMVLK
jgi:hypothetical protein